MQRTFSQAEHRAVNTYITRTTIRRAVILATLALAALCGAVVAVAGPGGYVVQFGACLVVGCAVVAAAKRGRG